MHSPQCTHTTMNCFGNGTCELRSSSELGRYVCASRDLKAGELLLCEQPVIVGPYWDSPVCCLSCYRESSTMCKTCKIAPLCPLCPSHDAYECSFLAAAQLPANFLLDHFDLITPLRCLMLATDAARAQTFATVWAMESHCEQRRNTAIWRLHERNVVAPLRALLSGAAPQLLAEHRDETFVQRICGILDVNTFEVRTANFADIPVRGLYPLAAMLPHDCTSNTFITVDGGEHALRVYASVPIAAGETVYNNYTSTLLGTGARGEHLAVGKYFRCECRRCVDPTELGTHFSSVACPSCAEGLCAFDARAAEWRCNRCEKRPSGERMQLILAEARQLAEMAGFDVCALEELIGQQSRLLNGNHHLVVDSKQKLAAILRSVCDEGGRLRRADELRLLQLKVRLCGELLPVLRTLKPGISRLTAIALYERFTSLARIAELKRSSLTAKEYLNCLIEAEQLAKQSVAMLVYEPRSTPEGHLAQDGMQQLRRLREQIAGHQKRMQRKK